VGVGEGDKARRLFQILSLVPNPWVLQLMVRYDDDGEMSTIPECWALHKEGEWHLYHVTLRHSAVLYRSTLPAFSATRSLAHSDLSVQGSRPRPMLQASCVQSWNIDLALHHRSAAF
jgi:hypothetical protein